MFTGLISDIGEVLVAERGTGGLALRIGTRWDLSNVSLGASIACSGACLSVTEKGDGWFAVEASHETMAKTTAGDWRSGTRINLERALRMGDELGGHLVLGHVDGVTTVADRVPDGDSVRFTFDVPADLARYIVPKGSVALDGISLTVNEVTDKPGGGCAFGVNIIPQTLEWTTIQHKQPGDRLNLETDMLARYLERLQSCA